MIRGDHGALSPTFHHTGLLPSNIYTESIKRQENFRLRSTIPLAVGVNYS